MRTPLVVSTILTVTGALGAGVTGSSAQAVVAADTVPTRFALEASGFGSTVRGGDVPAGSDTTAFQAIGCTNRTGIDRENHQAAAQIPDLGEATEIRTRTWTSLRNGVVSTNSVNTIERITIGSPDTGMLEINAIRSLSRAFHDAQGFHAKTATRIGSIDYTDATGPHPLEIPTPDQPLVTPVATVKLGSSTTRESASGAVAFASALLIQRTPTSSKVKVAHSSAEIASGVMRGLFSGFSSASRATGLQDNVSSGRTPLSLMPCQGTGGEERFKSIAYLQVAPNIELHALSSRQLGDQTRRVASGFERGRVNEVEILTQDGDALLIKNIIGRANVVRTGDRVTSNTTGTDMGAVLVNGENRSFPDSDEVLEIPGVAKLQREIVTKYSDGLFVTALRITLLDGSGAVLNLGQARLQIRDSGL